MYFGQRESKHGKGNSMRNRFFPCTGVPALLIAPLSLAVPADGQVQWEGNGVMMSTLDLRKAMPSPENRMPVVSSF
jgi:hypothetical protein